MPRRTTKAPSAADLLRDGTWSVEQVAALLDTPDRIVMRWCQLRLIPGAVHRQGTWQIPGRGLFFFCGGSIERMYSLDTAAAMLELSKTTLEGWVKRGTMKKVKWGVEKQSDIRITEGELMKFMRGES